MSATTTNLVVAVVAALLGAPFLNFLLQLTRRRVDKDNSIVTGAGDAVEALSEALSGLRKELGEVRDDLADARVQLDEQKTLHRTTVQEMRKEHQREIEDIRLEHREEMRQLEERLTNNP